MNKKSKNGFKISIIVLTLILTLFNLQNSDVSAALVETIIVDNDNNKVDSFYNDYIGTWNREEVSYSYRGDHRFNPTTSGGYRWHFFGGNGALYKAVSVYLKNAKFTNPSARYFLEATDGSNSFIYGTVNQNIAPEGWSRVSDTYGYGNKPLGVLRVSSNGYANTGADGAMIEYNN
jgi:hypothetical protein